MVWLEATFFRFWLWNCYKCCIELIHLVHKRMAMVFCLPEKQNMFTERKCAHRILLLLKHKWGKYPIALISPAIQVLWCGLIWWQWCMHFLANAYKSLTCVIICLRKCIWYLVEGGYCLHSEWETTCSKDKASIIVRQHKLYQRSCTYLAN